MLALRQNSYVKKLNLAVVQTRPFNYWISHGDQRDDDSKPQNSVNSTLAAQVCYSYNSRSSSC